MGIIIIGENMMVFDPKRYGRQIESGLSNPQKTQFWLSIPKCATNTISSYLFKLGWKDDESNSRNYEKIYVFLRDPIDRWKSATLELCYHFFEHNRTPDNKQKFQSWFKNRKFENFDHNVDLHHVRQTDFMYYCDRSICEYVLIDRDINTKLKQIFGIQQPIVSKNTTQGNEYKQYALPYVEEIVNNDRFLAKLRQFYSNDFELIQQVKDSQTSKSV